VVLTSRHSAPSTAPAHCWARIWIAPGLCLLPTPAQEQPTAASMRDPRCPQRRGGEVPSPPLRHPSHHPLPAALCPVPSPTYLPRIHPATPSTGPKQTVPTQKTETRAGRHPHPEEHLALCPASGAPETGSTWTRGANAGNQACQLAAEDGEEVGRAAEDGEEVGRAADGTRRNAAGAEELRARLGGCREGLDEPTRPVRALAPLAFQPAFTKSRGNYALCVCPQQGTVFKEIR